MGARPHKPGRSASSAQIQRAATISQFEVADAAPDSLTLLKRKVAQFDALEVSNNANWVTAVAAITEVRYRRLFQGGKLYRLRYRYAAYGSDNATVTRMRTILTTALP